MFGFLEKLIRIKGLAYFFIDDVEGLRNIKKKKFDISKKSFTFQKKEYIIDLKKAIREKRDRYVLHYRINETHPVGFEGSHDSKSDSEMLNTVIENKILNQLLGGHNEVIYLIIIMGLVMCLIALSFIAMQFFISIPISVPANQTITPVTPIKPIPPP